MSQEIKQPMPSFYIDLEKVIAGKSPNLLKWLPKFLLRYLKKIVHVDEINEFLRITDGKSGLEFVDAVIEHFNITVKIVGLENVPSVGNQFVISNHPLGGLDGITLFYVMKKVRTDLKFPVNDLLMNLKPLTPLLVPINKHGRNTENLNALETAFSGSEMLLFFPAGLVSRRQKGGIYDLEWKPTFVSKSIKYKRDIIPVFFDAYNSSFFYNLAWWRKKLGIKANIEMLYLVDELFKTRNKTVTVYIGEKIPHTTFDKSKSPKEWAIWMKKLVYSMKK